MFLKKLLKKLFRAAGYDLVRIDDPVYRYKHEHDLTTTAQLPEHLQCMKDKQYIFIGGLHRSGTSLLHKIIRAHPRLSGFENTGVHEDEGQLIQTVYPTDRQLGGPGRFGLNPASFMDENHPLVTQETANRLMQQWSLYWDLSKAFLVEKSPTNILRTRFLQKLFPGCKQLVILRHPIAVAYATMRWKKEVPFSELLENTLTCYERFREDLPMLSSCYVLRYEDFVKHPHDHLADIANWLKVSAFTENMDVRPDCNDKYADEWAQYRQNGRKKQMAKLAEEFEQRSNIFGYTMANLEQVTPVTWLGAQESTQARETVGNAAATA